MIAEKITGKLSDTEKRVDKITVEWFEREKKILRKTTSSGLEIGIKIDSALNQDDIIFENDDMVVAVDIAPCDLIKISVSGIREMGRLCFELGNRHLSLSVTEDTVRCPFDEPTFEYLKKLGFRAEKVHEKFEDYIECKAHAASHSHSHHHEHHHEH